MEITRKIKFFEWWRNMVASGDSRFQDGEWKGIWRHGVCFRWRHDERTKFRIMLQSGPLITGV